MACSKTKEGVFEWVVRRAEELHKKSSSSEEKILEFVPDDKQN